MFFILSLSWQLEKRSFETVAPVRGYGITGRLIMEKAGLSVTQ